MSKLTSVIPAPTLYFQRLDEENEVIMDDPIKNLDSFSTRERKRLAESIAWALALLESELRRMQFIDEVIRWLAREYSRDILSFRERVSFSSYPSFRSDNGEQLENWVIQSILHGGSPEYIGLRYYLFYRVAKV